MTIRANSLGKTEGFVVVIQLFLQLYTCGILIWNVNTVGFVHLRQWFEETIRSCWAQRLSLLPLQALEGLACALVRDDQHYMPLLHGVAASFLFVCPCNSLNRCVPKLRFSSFPILSPCLKRISRTPHPWTRSSLSWVRVTPPIFVGGPKRVYFISCSINQH